MEKISKTIKLFGVLDEPESLERYPDVMHVTGCDRCANYRTEKCDLLSPVFILMTGIKCDDFLLKK